MFKPALRERATALISAIAAIAILGLAATAQPSRTSPAERLARLESDLRYQMDLAARVDRTKFDERTISLNAALAEWRKSAQSPQDYEAMTDWLRTALLQSLPGESGQWPAPPKFGVPAPKVHIVQKPIAKEPPPPVIAKSAPPPKVVAEKPAPIERAVAAKPKPAPVAKAKVEVAKLPAPTPAQTAATYRSVKAEPVVAKPRVEKAKTPAVQVNLAELNARVAGYHEGLREIEAALVARREGLTVGQVAQMVGQLEQLAGQYQFVQLYYDALTRNERRSVTEPRSMAETVELVERERARVETADDDDFLVTKEPTVEAGELAMRLKALAEVAERGGTRCCD